MTTCEEAQGYHEVKQMLLEAAVMDLEDALSCVVRAEGAAMASMQRVKNLLNELHVYETANDEVIMKQSKTYPGYTKNKVRRCPAAVIRQAVADAARVDRPLDVLAKVGAAIPLTHTCGAVLDYSYVRLNEPEFKNGKLSGIAVSEDEPDMKVTFDQADIVTVCPDIVEIRYVIVQ